MSSGGDKHRGNKEQSMSLTDEDRKRRDDMLKSIMDDTTISDLTKKEMSAGLTDQALTEKIKKAAEGRDTFQDEAYNIARQRASFGNVTNQARRDAENELFAKYKADILSKEFSSVSSEFETAQNGIGSKYKSRQLQQTMGELTRDQPGLLQTRIVK